jgi:hypothetical protein
MTSFKKARDLAVAFDAGYMDEEEFLLLWTSSKSKNPDFSVECYTHSLTWMKNTLAKLIIKLSFAAKRKIFLICMAEVPRIHDEFKCRQAKVQFAMV